MGYYQLSLMPELSIKTFYSPCVYRLKIRVCNHSALFSVFCDLFSVAHTDASLMWFMCQVHDTHNYQHRGQLNVWILNCLDIIVVRKLLWFDKVKFRTAWKTN